MFKDLIKQTVICTSLKIRFDYDDGSFEELLGTVEDGKIHFSKHQGYLDLLVIYKSLIMPLPYVTVFIGVKDLKHDNDIWFNQGTFRIIGDYSYTDLELKQLHIVALNDKEQYRKCAELQKEKILDNDFIQSILISESEYLENYEKHLCSDYKDRFYITTKLCPFANKCCEVTFKKKDSKDVCKHSIESFRHDLKNGTTKWELNKL